MKYKGLPGEDISSPDYIVEKEIKTREVVLNQQVINHLIYADVPDKYGIGGWLSCWITSSDIIGVDNRKDRVLEILKERGFEDSQHVGRKDLKEHPKDMLEYVAGQVINMLESIGTAHPMLSGWAEEAHEAILKGNKQ